MPSTPDHLPELSGMDAETLLAQARSWAEDGVVGEPLLSADPVNVPMVREFCEAIGDTNPVYVDESAGDESRHKGLIMPPAMLGVWTMGTPRNAGGPRDQVMRRLDAAGYTSVVATDYSHEYLVPVRPGDRIHERRSVEDVVGPKTTSLGEGVFVMSRYDYHTEDGTLVGIARMRLLKFRPQERTSASTPRPGRLRPRPVVNSDNQFYWDGVAERELRVQRCTGCHELRHPPGPMCPRCRSTDWDWVVASGRGTVHSYAIHHHPPLPGIELPHPVVLVELEEGVRIVADVAGMSHRDVAIGLPVVLTWKGVDVERGSEPGVERGSEPADELTVPAFAPASGTLPEPPPPPRSVEDVAVGTEVPGFDVEMTSTFIIRAALASRDMEEVHHDAAIARARGSEDQFPNILTSNGLALRLVTDWLGPEAWIRSASIRLGLPAYVGEVLRVRGEVVRVTPEDNEGEIEIAVRGRISTGDHMTGSVVATLPMRGET